MGDFVSSPREREKRDIDRREEERYMYRETEGNANDCGEIEIKAWLSLTCYNTADPYPTPVHHENIPI